MSEKPVAGTYRLDGMIEGPTPESEIILKEMKAWIVQARIDGFVFHLALDGGNFSLVTDPSAQNWNRANQGDPGLFLEDMLGAFVDLIHQEGSRGAFSTVRCEEFRPGNVVQTLLSVNAEGILEKVQREVDCETQSARPGLALSRFRKALIPIMLLFLVAGGISYFFVDYSKLFQEARDRIVPLKKEEVTLDQSKLADVIEVEISDIDHKEGVLILRVSRGPEWKKAKTSGPSASMQNWATFLLHQALHRGQLSYHLFGQKQKLLGGGRLRIDGLSSEEEIQVAIPVQVAERLVEVSFYP